MTSFKILNIRNFTSQLFREATFDHFLVTEAEFATAFTVKIDGRQLTSDPEGEAEDDQGSASKINSEDFISFISWQELRPLAYQIIRGKKLPQHFHIVLKLNQENTNRTLTYLGFPEEGVGLYLNLRYEQKMLFCITGCSRSTFSLDRSLEKEWDNYIQGFLRRHQLDFEAG